MPPTLSEASLGVKILVFVMMVYVLWVLAHACRISWMYFVRGDSSELKDVLKSDHDHV